MHRMKLAKIVRKIWPEYRWNPVDVSKDKSYTTTVAPYTLRVEWIDKETVVTISRDYDKPDFIVSVKGSSDGNTAEAARRAYFSAKASWISLNSVHLDPRQSEPDDIMDDYEYFKRYFGLD